MHTLTIVSIANQKVLGRPIICFISSNIVIALPRVRKWLRPVVVRIVTVRGQLEAVQAFASATSLAEVPCRCRTSLVHLMSS